MRYGSVCSGIEAATAAWHPLGWEPAFFSEIEKFPRAVLEHYYPDVPLHGDFTTIEEHQYGPIDLLVGGTPCQSFSVAGLRGGLDDDRGNLALEFLRLAQRTRPRWLVWENVPGVLSSNGGRDFGSILGGLVELGYGFAYRVLDAQYFGVAQRRRRVFVVGYLGDWRPAAAVLFERQSLRGDSAPRRETGEDVALDVIKGAAIGRKPENGPQYGDIISDGTSYTLNCTEVHAVSVPATTGAITAKVGSTDGAPEIDANTRIPWPAPVASTMNAAFADKMGLEDQHALAGASYFVPALNCNRDGAPIAFQANATADQAAAAGHNVAPTMATTPNSQPAVAFMENQRGEVRTSDQTDPLSTGGGKPGQGYPAAMQNMSVRRLTPVECERLQGFPDNYTRIPWRGKAIKECPDGPRYKALGNSMAVPVMRWIGERIGQVEEAIAVNILAEMECGPR